MKKTISVLIVFGMVLLVLSCSEKLTPPDDPPDNPSLRLSLNDKHFAQSGNEFDLEHFKNIDGDDSELNNLISLFTPSNGLSLTDKQLAQSSNEFGFKLFKNIA